MEDKQQFMVEAYELQTGHYLSLMHALAAALTHCVVWRHDGTDDKYDALQMCRFAEEFDREHPIKDRSFYMVSAEGAIGISPGLEYLTKWMFIPAMDEVSVAKLQSDIRELEAQTKAEEEAKEKARIEAEEKAKHEAEEKARREAEEKAHREAEEKAKREAEEKARREAEEKAKREAEEKTRREAEEQARKQAELRSQETKAQEPAAAPATPRAKFCRECGTPYKNLNVNFCGNCGAPRR